MIPYLDVPRLYLGPVWIATGTFFLALAILTGHFLFLSKARRRGLDPRIAANFSACMLFGGLVLGHLVKILYLPNASEIVQQAPVLLLQVLNGQSSFGGILGGALAGALYLRAKAVDSRRYLDALAEVFPLAWIFGRMHCVAVHDHPGLRTDSFLGVRYPDGVRFDLAVLEILFLVALIPLLNRFRPRLAPGGLTGIFLLSYGLFRFALDRLHVDPVRYAGITVDQYAAAVAVIAGMALLYTRKPGTSLEAVCA